MTKNKLIEYGLPLLCLLVASVTILQPSIVYAPQARVTLFLVLALMPAAFFATRVAAHFELKLPGFALTAGGAMGAVFGTFLLLNHFSKPEEQIAVFDIRDESGTAIPLELPQTVEVGTSSSGVSVTKCTAGNRLFLVFPEQVPTVDVDIVHPATGKRYGGHLSYAGTRTYRVRLGKDLKAE